MEVNIRNAVLGDIPKLNKISLESKRHWGYPEEWIEKWKNHLMLKESDFERQEVYVLEVMGAVAGFCAIEETDGAYEINHLWVLPQYIGKGYGKLLLNESIKNVVVNQKKILVEADPNAEDFYKSQGFVTIDKVESFPKGRFLPVMERLSENFTDAT